MKKGLLFASLLSCLLLAACFGTTDKKSEADTPHTPKKSTIGEEILKDTLAMSVAEWEVKIQHYMDLVNDFAKTSHSGDEIADFQDAIDAICANLGSRKADDMNNMYEACRKVKVEDLEKLKQSVEKIKVMYESDMQRRLNDISLTEQEMEKLFSQRNSQEKED